MLVMLLNMVPEDGIWLKELQAKMMGTHIEGKGFPDFDEVKRLYRSARKMEAVLSFRNGSHFFVERGKNYRLVLEGRSGEKLEPVRVGLDHPLDRPVWGRYMAAYYRGELDMVFIPTDATRVGYRLPDDPETHRVERKRKKK